MFEHMPRWLGAALIGLRAGYSNLTIARDDLNIGESSIYLSSPAFPDRGRLPERFTRDGDGISPPLVWSGVSDRAVSLALLVEDAGAPAPAPLAHALAWGIAPDDYDLPEGAMSGGSTNSGALKLGRNSFFAEGWLPPDLPPGHGTHHYAFQLFALSAPPEIGQNAGRTEFVEAIDGLILGAGLLIGTYSRGDAAPATSISPVRARG